MNDKEASPHPTALTALGERTCVLRLIGTWRAKPMLTDAERALLDTITAQIREGLHIEDSQFG
jgi:hypothetical protein